MEIQPRNRIEQIVDSANFKLLQTILVAIVIPIGIWGMQAVVGKLGNIEEKLASINTQYEVDKIYRNNLTEKVTGNIAIIQTLRDQGSDHEYRLRRLEELKGVIK